ncbi:hypothetical protein TREVI0001_2100 [Treponema vincentii ATCC 35580]|uniref:Uncharacterized protein n=1 Tax=Treponema vincentii ATCC 35580 TaxID=596324 RepID=C8PQJ6_9SPIR|nr:hypothetical protein TREVI0001_2100 [Treponema vincentii ATCC 35580]
MALFSPFANKWASTSLFHKKQSSTYSKYACGCFLLMPRICFHLFAKGLILINRNQMICFSCLLVVILCRILASFPNQIPVDRLPQSTDSSDSGSGNASVINTGSGA